MSMFIPPGWSGVVVITSLVLVALVTVAVLTAAAVGRRQDYTVLNDPRPEEYRRIVKP